MERGDTLKVINDYAKSIGEKLAEYNKGMGHNYVPPEDVFRLSSAGLCARKIYYGKKYNIEFDNTTQRIFLVGQVLHNLIQDVVFDKHDCEATVSGEWGAIKLVGHCDAMSEDEVIELKTCAFLPTEPHFHHILQANAYGYLLGKDRCKIIYVTKNKLEVKAFEFPVDKVNFDLVGAVFSRAYEGLQNDTLPDNNPNPMCKFCNYEEKCKGNIL